MTMHDALYFLSWLHEEIQKTGSFTEKGSWPTHELVALNFRANRKFFPRDKDVLDSFKSQMRIARARRWVVLGPCSRSCHAKHWWMPQAGLAVLEQWNRDGCPDGSGFHFVQAEAA